MAASVRAALACDRPRCACRHAGGRMTHCPAHPDRSPSLAVTERDGRVLVCCLGACAQDAVITALRARGVWQVEAPEPGPPRRRDPGLELAQQQARRAGAYWAACPSIDEAKAVDREVAEARRVATLAGDTEEAWALLALAAQLERDLQAPGA